MRSALGRLCHGFARQGQSGSLGAGSSFRWFRLSALLRAGDEIKHQGADIIAPAFTRAFARAKSYLIETEAAEIAAAQKPLFPKIDEAVLADCIASYQKIGCWQGPIDITAQGYEAMLDIFAFDDKIKTRYAYDAICASPPEY